MQACNYLGGFGNLYVIISALYFNRKPHINQILSELEFHDLTSNTVLTGRVSCDGGGLWFLSSVLSLFCRCKLLDCFKSTNKCRRKGILY